VRDIKTTSEVRKVRAQDRIKSRELPTLSSAIIKLLKRLDFKQADIAVFLRKSPSFVSHVSRNRRSLDIEDVENIARGTGLPVFWLILEATGDANIPENLKPTYMAAKVLFNYTIMAKLVGDRIMK